MHLHVVGQAVLTSIEHESLSLQSKNKVVERGMIWEIGEKNFLCTMYKYAAIFCPIIVHTILRIYAFASAFDRDFKSSKKAKK